MLPCLYFRSITTTVKLLFLNSEISRKKELEYKAKERAKGGECELYLTFRSGCSSKMSATG
jgi:hypothetical protein